MIVQLTERHRLKPLDSRNWKLQEYRAPKAKPGQEPAPARWVDTENYFSSVGRAAGHVLAVESRTLRRDEVLTLTEFMEWHARATGELEARCQAAFEGKGR